MKSNEMEIVKSEKSTSFSEKIQKYYNQFGIFIIFFLMVIALSFATDKFLQYQNLINVIRQISFIAIIATGSTFIIITGGIDLSPGSIMGLTSAISSMLAQQNGLPLIVSLAIGLGLGAFCGFTNGFLVAKTKIPPFIATLGMMEIARGVALLITNGRPVGNISRDLEFLGKGSIFGIPFPIFILVIVTFIMFVLLNNTPFGRRILALGGNEQAAKISGISVEKVKIIVYTMGGLLAALAGILMTGRVASGQPKLGVGFEMDAVAAAVIGGTSLSGGIGSIFGTLCGALVIGVINNGMDLLSVSAYWQQIVKGVIIVGAVILDQLKHRK